MRVIVFCPVLGPGQMNTNARIDSLQPMLTDPHAHEPIRTRRRSVVVSLNSRHW